MEPLFSDENSRAMMALSSDLFGKYPILTNVSTQGVFEIFPQFSDAMNATADYADIQTPYIADFSVTESFAMSQSNQAASTSQSLSQSASEMSDSIMSSWENRNRSQDIMSQKQSDATLGYERIVDTETGNIYKIDNGFTDWYDGSRYKSITDDQYTDSVEAVIHWK